MTAKATQLEFMTWGRARLGSPCDSAICGKMFAFSLNIETQFLGKVKFLRVRGNNGAFGSRMLHFDTFQANFPVGMRKVII